MAKLSVFFLIFLLIPSIFAYDNIIEFDENEDIIISTTVHDGVGQLCTACSCNLTIYNTHPNESLINISILMKNQGNGIFSINVSNYTTLRYDKDIYPMTLLCNDTAFFGGDDKEGIKVGATLFDYTGIILALFGIGAVLMFASFKIDKSFWKLQLFTFFGSLPFFIGAIFTGLEIVKHSPNNANFILIFDIMFWAILAVALVLFYLRFVDLMANRLDQKNVK